MSFLEKLNIFGKFFYVLRELRRILFLYIFEFFCTTLLSVSVFEVLFWALPVEHSLNFCTNMGRNFYRLCQESGGGR